MKTTFLRALALAGFSLFATAAMVAPTPVYAADKSSEPTLSKTFGKYIKDIKQFSATKDWPNLIAKLQEAKAVCTADYDQFFIDDTLGAAYYQSGDLKNAAAAFVAATKIPGMPADKHTSLVNKALAMLFDIKDYAGAIAVANEQYKADTPMSEDIARSVGVAYYFQNDYANALAYGRKAVEIGSVGGKTPHVESYELIIEAQGKMKDLHGQNQTFDTMAGLYGDGEYWSHALEMTFGTLTTPNKQARELAFFYLSRLRLVVDADSTADDYLIAAQVARSQNSPGDIVKAFDTAKLKNKYDAKKSDALFGRALIDAKKDKSTLGAAEAIAVKSPKADMALSVGESYFGYGQFAEAERMAAAAVAKGGPRISQSLLLLGVSQTMQGKTAEATATFAKVKGDPFDRVAELWSIYANRKYGRAPAATPAN